MDQPVNPKHHDYPSAIGPTGPAPTGREISVVRTYLAMSARKQFVRGRALSSMIRADLVHKPHCTVAEWRQLYTEIGDAWHWHDRDSWPDAELAARLTGNTVSVYAVQVDLDGARLSQAGFLELERHDDGSVEIVYLGLHPRVFGMGLGAWLVGEAVDRAFALGVERVWLHTCTLDAPAALPNYLARGFTIERAETYVALRSP